jgi:nitrate reductase (NAD(P)H)
MTSLSPPYFNSLHGSQKDQKNENEQKDPSLSQAHLKRPGSLGSSPPMEHLTYTPPISENESESSSSDEESTDSLTQDENTSALHDTGKPYCLPPPSIIQGVLPEDLDTPDSHVPRDPRLIRLTGVHPFNVEPPLSDLYNEGFLTSVNLHFVRNHGLVPVCEDNDMLDWEFTVEGMVKNPIKMTLRDLVTDYDQITYPMTMVCAGNRRKEQNMVRKSKGFSWGAAGLSTALWTGVPIGELLARAQPKRGARYVCFEGADELPNGYYGTSVKLNWCLDPNKGIIVAHKMNGETLQPDHGKPVRIIVPGSIGGRSVKWLRKIIVTSEPSDNWYHIYDNRVLPTEVTPETSDHLPEVWRDERYAIYGLNVNSVVCFPAHGETLSLRPRPARYRVRGYAYAGAGRRVTRTEVTLDRGKSWELARMRYPEDDYRSAPDDDTLYGGQLDVWWRETSFCWSFWEIDIPITRLLQADDIMIRAMDEGLASQPRDMYWNVTGMMNNPWFRVVIHRNEDSLTFEHPTQPALMPGGWMERVKKAGGDLANGFWGEQLTIPDKQPEAPITKEKEIRITNPDVNRVVSLEELKRHSGKTEPWFVVDGEVYDGTPFLDEHPGGATSIYGVAGQDSSEAFTTIRKLALFPSDISLAPIYLRQSLTKFLRYRQRKCKGNVAQLPHWHA